MAADNGPVVDAPMTMAEFFASLKDELKSRYRNRFLASIFIALAANYWKILVFFLIGDHSAEDTIGFVERQLSWSRTAVSLLEALVFTLGFPWVDWLVSLGRARGEQRRHDFQFREQERQNQRRKRIAEDERLALQLEDANWDKNREIRNRVADENLAQKLRERLHILRLSQRLTEVQPGVIDERILQAIGDYIDFAGAPEAWFTNPEAESLHRDFLDKAGRLHDALQPGYEAQGDIEKIAESVRLAHKKFLNFIRKLLG